MIENLKGKNVVLSVAQYEQEVATRKSFEISPKKRAVTQKVNPAARQRIKDNAKIVKAWS